MKTIPLGLLIILSITGCSLAPPVKLEGLTPSKHFVTNHLDVMDYPGFMAGAGNIYSCRYGIDYIEPDGFSPSRLDIFESLLTKYSPKIEQHKVTLTQFDVYYNRRLKLLNAAAPALGGGIASDIARRTAERGHYGFMYKNFLIDTPQTFPMKTEEVVVGCDNANEGEYYPSRVSGGHDVVVSWFAFTVNDQSYNFRTLYQFQPESREDIQKGIAKAIDKSLGEIAIKLKI